MNVRPARRALAACHAVADFLPGGRPLSGVAGLRHTSLKGHRLTTSTPCGGGAFLREALTARAGLAAITASDGVSCMVMVHLLP